MICLISCGVFFAFKGHDETKSTANQKTENNAHEFLIADNTNGAFDPNFDEKSYSVPTMPDEAVSLPLDNFDKLKELDFVDHVYPYYPLVVQELTDGQATVIEYYENNSDEVKTIEMPLYTGTRDGLGNLEKVNFLRFKLVTDYSEFYDVYENETINVEGKGAQPMEYLVKEFDSDSGVYISDFLYQQLGVSEDATNLTLEIPVQVPLVAEVSEQHHEFKIQRHIRLIIMNIVVLGIPR